MAKPRVFALSDSSQAGVYHVVSRVVDRQFRFGEREKAVFAGMMRGFAAFHQVEILTYCLMGNHFHLLVKVPVRPEGFDLGFSEVMGLWQRAVSAGWHRGMERQFGIYRRSGSEAAIDEWRRRMVGRMFSLSEFMKSLKQRFTQWYNRKNEREGTLWSARYRSVIVEDENRALRTMATYIDLNPVRAGITDDPGKYRWSGYADALAGRAAALEAIATITGATAERVMGRGLGEGAPVETLKQRRRRHLRALIVYRQMLGLAGRERVREDGVVVRSGVSEKVRARLEDESGVRREMLLKRVRHLTAGVVFGSREYIDGWFERNRGWFRGASAENRKTGARKIAKDWKRLYTLRELRK